MAHRKLKSVLKLWVGGVEDLKVVRTSYAGWKYAPPRIECIFPFIGPVGFVEGEIS